MAESDFVFESGEPIDIGNPVENNYVEESGKLVSDGDKSDFVFISGRGLGASWTELATPPDTGAMAIANGGIYLGNDGTVEGYDISSDSWGNGFSRNTNTENAFAWVGYDGEIYQLKGDDGSYDRGVLTYKYSTSGDTTRLADAGDAVDDVEAAESQGRILVPSGEKDNFDSSNSSYSEYYDVDSDSWIRTADIPQPVRGYEGAGLTGEAWILGGVDAPLESNPQTINDVQIYDFSSDSWSSGDSFPESAVGAACSDDNDVVYGAYQNKFYRNDGSGWEQLENIPGSNAVSMEYDPDGGGIYVLTNEPALYQF